MNCRRNQREEPQKRNIETCTCVSTGTFVVRVLSIGFIFLFVLLIFVINIVVLFLNDVLIILVVAKEPLPGHIRTHTIIPQHLHLLLLQPHTPHKPHILQRILPHRKQTRHQ
ncbi:hypothetical protein BDV98DRAFT_572869 [Pterulicium gracile]|uniref:Uncharacterized protein n=1 Tax=Pterulicium gracile TaxID=1884261 RepID=A0A5C3QBH0_9AGAR|nr:hypothetical protein BDV98DRAFT_572869 [Pterula gracilis]